MGNSSLVDVTVKSPNHSGKRTHSIDTLTPHCVVGQLSAESIGGCFTSTARKASCNYGIGTDGRVVLCVDEGCRSWCSSSNENDQRAVTIECASDKTEPYAMNNTVYEKLIELCADICKRNGKTKVLWLGSREKTLAYTPKSNEMVLTAHRWFANKSCPGNWLYSRYGELADRINALLGSGSSAPAPETPAPTTPAPATSKEGVKYRMNTLKKGSTGNDVTIFESIMKKMGYYTGKIDTNFGSGCVAATNAFQKNHPECGTNGKPDGSFGPKCWNKALSLIGA